MVLWVHGGGGGGGSNIQVIGLSPVIIFDGYRMSCSELASSPGA